MSKGILICTMLKQGPPGDHLSLQPTCCRPNRVNVRSPQRLLIQAPARWMTKPRADGAGMFARLGFHSLAQRRGRPTAACVSSSSLVDARPPTPPHISFALPSFIPLLSLVPHTTRNHFHEYHLAAPGYLFSHVSFSHPRARRTASRHWQAVLRPDLSTHRLPPIQVSTLRSAVLR